MTRADALRDLLAAVEAGTWQLSQDAGTLFSDSAYSDAFAAFDGSKDAAIVFVEAVLPDWGWGIIDLGLASIWRRDKQGKVFQAECDDNPARALLIAALKAMISEQRHDASKS